MAVLPDIDTTGIGKLSYYNVIDQGGVDSINPDDVLSWAKIDGYVVYDNGVEMTVTIPDTGGRSATCRVKNDGWMVVYFDHKDEHQRNVSDRSKIYGYWNAHDVNDGSDIFINFISEMIDELSNSGDVAWIRDDVAETNYEFTKATTRTTLYSSGGTSKYEWTSGTTRYHHTTFGKSGYNSKYKDSSSQGFASDAVGHISLMSLASDPDTEYTHTLGGEGYGGNEIQTLFWS